MLPSISSPTGRHIFPAFDFNFFDGEGEDEHILEKDKDKEKEVYSEPHFDFGEIEEQQEDMDEQKRRRQKFPDHLFSDIEPEIVDELPTDLNGQQMFKIMCTQKQSLEKQTDKRHFVMKVSKRKGFSRRRRIGWCSGTLKCLNKDCPYYRQTTTRNYSHWKRGNAEGKTCYCCGKPGVLLPCPARKMTEYDNDKSILTVYHVGDHTCTVKMDTSEYDAELEKISKKYSHLPAMQALNQGVVEHVRSGQIEAAAMQARETANSRRFIQMHRKNRKVASEGKDSIEAVAKLKEDCKAKDPFLVYRVNGEGMNKDPGYAFKTSRESLEMCLDMDWIGQ